MTTAQVKRFRKRHRLTLQVIADRCGVRLMTVWRWVHGVYEPAPASAAILLTWQKELESRLAWEKELDRRLY